jgi:hypothetical protein
MVVLAEGGAREVQKLKVAAYMRMGHSFRDAVAKTA